MTYRELCARLTQAGIESAEWDAALLIEHFCGVRAEEVRLGAARDYDKPALAEAAERRTARYPLQYLLGEWQFYRQSYEVSPDCLIPRSDTEILVEEAIKLLPRGAYFADLCTGSGCIAVSVLAERPDTQALAVEKFPDTLALAERNAVRNGARQRFAPLCADVLTPHCLPDGVLFDAILSNPPYIPERDLAGLAPELDAEPRVALDGGDDGLIFYRRIVEQQAAHLKAGGFFLFEIGYDQADAVREIGVAAGFDDCRVIKDYGGNDRVVLLKKRTFSSCQT
ncbi:MAG: peptide chain release factor N(5)-glutamine methyltransferase [Clostridia bacterium]|nr:peptide chain release factor N(5)-glutamine methyltransferase [Clostridia bacterium]